MKRSIAAAALAGVVASKLVLSRILNFVELRNQDDTVGSTSC
jgi:hypothetical protein